MFVKYSSQMFYRVLNTLLCPSSHQNEMQITQPAITCSELTIKTAEQCYQLRSGVFIVNFEHVFTPCSSISIVNFEQVNAGREVDGWLHFIKWFSMNSPIKQAFITQTFLETRTWKNLTPKLSTRLNSCLESVYRKRQSNKSFFFFMVIKSYLKICQTQNMVRCRQLCSRCMIRAHPKCILGAS